MKTTYRAAKNAFIFQRSIDGFGKMYSIIPSLSKYFAVQSDFKPGRESSLILFDIFKVWKNVWHIFKHNCQILTFFSETHRRTN